MDNWCFNLDAGGNVIVPDPGCSGYACRSDGIFHSGECPPANATECRPNINGGMMMCNCH
jgi:hypothetical protein